MEVNIYIFNQNVLYVSFYVNWYIQRVNITKTPNIVNKFQF